MFKLTCKCGVEHQLKIFWSEYLSPSHSATFNKLLDHYGIRHDRRSTLLSLMIDHEAAKVFGSQAIKTEPTTAPVSSILNEPKPRPMKVVWTETEKARIEWIVQEQGYTEEDAKRKVLKERERLPVYDPFST